MKANTKRMDKDGNARPQGYRIYEITGDIPALGLGGGIAGASCLINDTRMKINAINPLDSQDNRVYQTDGASPTLDTKHTIKIFVDEKDNGGG